MITTLNIINSAKPFFLINTPPKKEESVFFVFTKKSSLWLKQHNFWSDKANQAPGVNFSEKPALVLNKIINHKSSVIIADYKDIKSIKLPTPENYFNQSLTITKGKINVVWLTGKLLALGFDKVKKVIAPGQLSVVGDTIHIIDNQKQLITISLWGDEIEKITLCQNELNEIKVLPFKLKPGTANIIDYLKLNTKIKIILDEPQTKDTPKYLLSQANYILESLSKTSKITTHIKPTPFYHQDFNKLKSDLTIRAKQGYQIYISSQHQDALIEKLNNVEYELLPFKITEGWQSQKPKILVLTDFEIFGHKARKLRQKRFKFDPDFIANLAPGDYVVHIDHGIGIFSKMNRNILSGVSKEYFTIDYQAGDKLYLPVDQADKITRYVGAPNPTLHRLSGSAWHQIRRQAKKDTTELAKNLLRLYATRKLKQGYSLTEDIDAETKLQASFPYKETEDQIQAIKKILADMAKETPMDRLLCGDVGFGKTEVAIRASFRAVLNQKQVALLAPTTILSQQHYQTFCQRLKGLNTKVEVINRFKSQAEQNKIIKNLSRGHIDIIIGTHRLLSKDIKLKNLGLLIIDEEQKFGVKHKERLKELKTNVDILTMSATPIPRTLNMSLSGIRDISTIKTAPKGRKSVKTIIKPFSEKLAKKAVAKELKRNGQIYWLHNRVATISAIAQQIQTWFPKAKVDIAHGQMTEEGLYQVMRDFNNQKVDILVCSSIIENGLDMPNVNTMIVDNSVYFGLSSLHQLRGRIGRSNRQGYAYFFYKTQSLTDKAKARLEALLRAKNLGDGFEIALRDMELRGVGNILGRQQSGNISSIGLYLYNQLLKQAIKELQTGRQEKPKLDVKIDLPITALLPASFIKSETTRFKLYQQISNLESDQIAGLKSWLIRHFGPLPQEVINLTKIIKLKNLASKIGINKISQSKAFGRSQIVLEFAHKLKNPDLVKLLDTNPNWTIKEKSLKINTKDLKHNYLDEMISSLKILTKNRLV